MAIEQLKRDFERVRPAGCECSLRLVEERHETIRVRQDVLQPIVRAHDLGVMITVREGSGEGYAATSDLSPAGLRAAVHDARQHALIAAGNRVGLDRPRAVHGEYDSAPASPWAATPLAQKIELVREQCARLNSDERIVDWEARLWHTEVHSCYLDCDGADVRQRFEYLVPALQASASDGVESAIRSLGGNGCCRQGGLEVLEAVGFRHAAPGIAAEAVELLYAPDCPSGDMDLVLAPDQMILQIHESIGHPLELDRILGDERNYAGTSFVTPQMFGRYRYGSDLLNITFDPSVHGQFASYAFDDDGTPAEREYLIRDGVLERGLGGIASQRRAALPGVANARACSWNRAPIDRMANLNLEPGKSSFTELIAQVERGVFMQSNTSWSIDDSRNKFQFGCERGQRIEDGELKGVVRKPNYRGISASFWRGLAGVGDATTRDLLGTPYCGKGEPNQCVRVGHASPACRFTNVSVFGGD